MAAARYAPPDLVLVHTSDELYGADRMVLEMVAALDPGTDVEVWLPTDLAHPPSDRSLCTVLRQRGITVRHLDLPIMRRAYRTPRGLLGLLGRSAGLLVELARVRPCTVYCTTSAALLAAPLARLARVPRVVGHFQEIWTAADAAVLGRPARACHTMVAISGAVTAALPPALRGRTVVVPNGTPEPPRVVPLEGRTGPLTFVVASRWNGWKGHATLLAAWDAAGCPGRLLVLGGPPPSGDVTDVETLVAGLTDPGSVEVVGEVADLGGWVETADVVLVPSDAPEPFGLVAIEAFARARPVVASAAGGLLDIVTTGTDGWLFPPRDVAALADLLASLTRDRVTAAGAAARQTYLHRFTTARFAEHWRRAVLAAADHPGPRSPVPTA
ncbi:MAG: hypothetical protein JWP61_574 [Friedmanniella sp.]|nr:hypothetical protein [Friedmanniella sp.]